VIGRISTARAGERPRLARLRAGSQDGFLLIEVMVSALLVGLIMIAMFNGFDVANRATADERAHAQADVLAQQDEDRLRGFQISELSAFHETRTVTYKEGTGTGTVYTITSKAQFISDATGTESCTAGAASADYIQTTSEVTWPALKARQPVVETGLIAPHLGGSLLVKVLDANGKGVSGMTVKATGPSPSTNVETGTTGANGCVIFGSVEPGEYKVTTFQTGYVEKNGNSEQPTSEQVATVTNGSTTTKSFEFAQAGELEVSFTGATPAEGDTFVAFNTGLTTFRPFGAAEAYKSTLLSGLPKTIFPFSSNYTVYAGKCESDNPETINKVIVDSSVLVTPGSTAKVSVTVPPVNIQVMSGKSSVSPGLAIENATVKVTDTGCGTVRSFKTNAGGSLPRPGLPFAKYSLCVTGGASGGNHGATTGLAANRKYTTAPFVNDTATGPSGLASMTNGGASGGFAVIYMENGAATSPGKLEAGSSCP